MGGLFYPPGYEEKWPDGLRTFVYLFLLLWSFLGVGIVADCFMAAIEQITSKEKVVRYKGKTLTVKIWNATIANLTLMALGSSAPEILLSVIEIVSGDFYNGPLGPRYGSNSSGYKNAYLKANAHPPVSIDFV